MLYDKKRVTLTTPMRAASTVLKQLNEVGVIAKEVRLRGRFHCDSYREDVETLSRYCDSHSAFQLPDASNLVVATRSSSDGDYSKTESLHRFALRSILVNQCNWYQTFVALQPSRFMPDDSLIATFGPERCVPPTLLPQYDHRLVHVASLNMATKPSSIYNDALAHNGIAVIGMACNVSGASDIEEFWELLCAGKSQHTEVPPSRFGFETLWRKPDPKRKWYGNFIQDHEAFDHKFFKKSPREMASTDPQHRLMLQTAYQAVEQSGYFASDRDKHIGCYIGAGLVDYENNIACYPANAYSATGNLKSFIAGKISHYFGWTGPGLTIDTACSSSSVAVHSACKAILSGECVGALAGGVNIMTHPQWFENLAGASFLSPTGQCRPFDEKADGYCRGEGVGAVFLKKFSSAVADGDQILGCIGGSSVYQNQNCTPITVPNADSLSGLFSDVSRQAGLEPKQISVVEAHGTGTSVGDPAEYDGICRVFGGLIRSDLGSLSLGSVKGFVGHTESASGIIALIKVLLMISKGFIPPQASFKSINPAIKASPRDKIEIPTHLKPWSIDFRAALINNYGASGSNASMIVTQTPASNIWRENQIRPSDKKYPFWFCGVDKQSLQAYSTRIRLFLRSQLLAKELDIETLSFQVARQSNRTLSHSVIFSCGSVNEVEQKLTAFETGDKNIIATARPAPRPVVLCFGGQISSFVGLDRQVYEGSKILRSHLDHCDAICRSMGSQGLYPEIFQKSPVQDVVKLQTMLFSIQYSCAMSWIQCGIEVAAVVGHSFGELTALGISGILSLEDALKMVIGRARLIDASWGDEKGSMMAIEASPEDVRRLLAESCKLCPGEPAPTIACYNGPRSFTVAGTTKAINIAAEVAVTSSLKAKKLLVTHAFHCALVEPLVTDLERLGKDLTFQQSKIPLEMATETATTNELTATYLAEHMRKPVFFNDAVQRLSQRYASCIWLEAGSNSTITTMASRALGSSSPHFFQPINVTTENSFQFLIDSTMNLWRAGLNVSFWPHHSVQTPEYALLLLPPYQFEKTKHWMELKNPREASTPTAAQTQILDVPKGLWSFVKYLDHKNTSVRYRINTMTKKFEDYVSGHKIAQTAVLCPSTLQLDIAIDVLMSLRPDFTDLSFQPQLQGMDSHTLMTLDPSRFVWLHVETNDVDGLIWDWQMISDNGQDGSKSTLHVTGRVVFRAAEDPQLHKEFAKYERLVKRQRCLRLLESSNADEVIQGRNVYKTFAEIVEYADLYKGVQKIVSEGDESAGRIIKVYSEETWLDTGLFDSFCQVAGIFVNCMTDRADGDMYISDRIDQWIRSPKLRAGTKRPEVWEVFASHHRPSDKEFLSDVFVFDPRDGALLEVILGIHYQKVSKAGFGKVLSRLSGAGQGAKAAPPLPPMKIEASNVEESSLAAPTYTSAAIALVPEKKEQPLSSGIHGRVRELLCDMSGLDTDQIKDDSDLVDIGIDSLMGMELAREIEVAFKCTLETSQLMDLTDFKSLIKCIQTTLGQSDDRADNEEHIGETDKDVSVAKVNSVVAHINGFASPGNDASSTDGEKGLPRTAILEAFGESKKATDEFIVEQKLGNYAHRVLPKSTELCIAHIVEAFEELGCSLRTMKPGQQLPQLPYLPRHKQFVDFVYHLLEKEARLIHINGSRLTRTEIPPPAKSAEALLQDLIRTSPDHASDHRLTYLTGAKLADCLSGRADALQLIFGSIEGKEIATDMYGKSPINMVWIEQMVDFLRRLLSTIPNVGEPINILEMGAGTGGTTVKIMTLLASLGIPVRYTVTDISSSLVAAARKRFKQYSFVECRTLNIEEPAAVELLHSQHIIIATNCIHATHSLAHSLKNVHDLLRPDGFLMMLEMTEPLPWVDMIFGLVEGWWLFDDGRQHALAPPLVWETTLQAVGYGHVDWTEGERPEASIQRIIIALASGPRYERALNFPRRPQSPVADSNIAARQASIDAFVCKYTKDFIPPQSALVDPSGPSDQCVLLTGATGSLGAHLVAYFASLPTVKTVICLNRFSSTAAPLRQHEALKSKGISLSAAALSKLQIFETDTAKPLLGLPSSTYWEIVATVTQIVHNAWPMSITRPILAFEPQFKTIANLIVLARDIACRRHPRVFFKVGLQFISSIATAGCFPLWSGNSLVPEAQMTAASVLPTGYGDAKLVCEQMLHRTLGQHPSCFRPMTIRIGQIAGSKTSGYWNPVEHFAFLVKSSQTLKALPALEGLLSWCPVNDVAATLGELLLAKGMVPYPVYHIENPTRQPWREMVIFLADALDIPRSNIVPFEEWVSRVRQFAGPVEADNPAARLIDFLDRHFVRMSCGNLVLDTAHSTEHSETLRSEGPVSEELVKRYVRGWKAMGFLHE